MPGILKRLFGQDSVHDCIVIVSGLPRSGTSMMMRMLEKGGMQTVTDNVRKADEDNPRGYYEFEQVKKIKEDQSWLDGCVGKAVKMVSMLLFDLPADRKYKIIFMKRNMDEILASQRAMLQRQGKDEGEVGDPKMAVSFGRHLRQVESWLENQVNMEVLYIRYNAVLQDPLGYAKTVSQFLGGRMNIDEMAGVVEESLYRQRSAEEGPESAGWLDKRPDSG